MIKARVSRKEVLEYYQYVISVPLPSTSFLKVFQPAYYTAGKYGWNADIYSFDSTAIVVGYRPFGKPVSYDEMAYWEKEAEIILKYTPRDEWCEKMSKLVRFFIQSYKY